MKKRVKLVAFPLLAVVLELLPYGAVLRFGRPLEDGPVEIGRSAYSYFDPGPFAYGNFGPLLTAWATVLLLLVSCMYWFNGKGRWGIAALSALAVLFSLMPLVMIGLGSFSLVGGLITLVLAAQAAMACAIGRKGF